MGHSGTVFLIEIKVFFSEIKVDCYLSLYNHLLSDFESHQSIDGTQNQKEGDYKEISNSQP